MCKIISKQEYDNQFVEENYNTLESLSIRSYNYLADSYKEFETDKIDTLFPAVISANSENQIKIKFPTYSIDIIGRKLDNPIVSVDEVKKIFDKNTLNRITVCTGKDVYQLLLTGELYSQPHIQLSEIGYDRIVSLRRNIETVLSSNGLLYESYFYFTFIPLDVKYSKDKRTFVVKKREYSSAHYYESEEWVKDHIKQFGEEPSFF